MSIQLDVDWGQAIILFLFASVGFTLMMVDSKILYPIRGILWCLGYLLDGLVDGFNILVLKCTYTEPYCMFFTDSMEYFVKCYMCQGFWIGLLCANYLVPELTIYQWIGCGFASSFLSMLFGTLISFIKVLDFNARER